MSLSAKPRSLGESASEAKTPSVLFFYSLHFLFRSLFPRKWLDEGDQQISGMCERSFSAPRLHSKVSKPAKSPGRCLPQGAHPACCCLGRPEGVWSPLLFLGIRLPGEGPRPLQAACPTQDTGLMCTLASSSIYSERVATSSPSSFPTPSSLSSHFTDGSLLSQPG